MSTVTASLADPVRIGPAGLPKRTLGWQALAWTAEWLRQPDGPDAGGPWTYTDEQARFVLWWYAVDGRGQFSYRRGMLRRLKGWGKDPLGATLCAIELCGPCRFGGWDAAGDPVAIAHPSPWVITAAVSLDQTKNTMRLFPSLFSDDAVDAYGIDLGKEIIYTRTGMLEAVTSSPRALEGKRTTFSLKNEAMELGTVIPTPSGWTTIGKLQDGDEIFGADGTVTTVTKALPVQHDRRCFEVTFEDHTSVVASDGHLWMTKVRSSAAKPKVRTTLEMLEDGRRFAVPSPGPRRTPDVDLPVDPYLLGYWLGDGSTGSANLTVGDEDLEVVEGILRDRGIETHRLNKLSNRAARISFSTRTGFGRDMGSTAAKALRDMPCYRDKRIPEQYLHAGTQQRIDLFRGLMDSDGCVSTNAQCIFVGTEELSADVVELARSLGQLVFRTFVPDVRSRHGGTWRVTFTARGGLVPFLIHRKAKKVRNSAYDGWVGVTSIREVPSVPVRCIAVSADDHLFQAGEAGHVTHNTHHWLENNDGLAMADVIARNLTKARGGDARSLAISNAHNPGEGSDAELDYEAYLSSLTGRAGKDFLYDSIEAPGDIDITDAEQVRQGLIAARGDSSWLDLDRHVAEILDPRTREGMARRFYFNQVVAGDDVWLKRSAWDALAVPRDVPAGTAVTCGFDGADSDDWTAFRCETQDGYQFTPRFSDGKPMIWDPAQHDGYTPRGEVNAAVAELFRRFKVVRMYCDPPFWQSEVDAWASEHGEKVVVRWATFRTRQMAEALERFRTDVYAARLSHDGCQVTSKHIENAHADHRPQGVLIRKDRAVSRNKIDAAMSSALAHEAALDVTAGNLWTEQRRGLTRVTGRVAGY